MKENTGTANLEVAKEVKHYTIDSTKIKTIKQVLEIMDVIGVVFPVAEGNDTFDAVIKKGLLKEIV